MLNWSRYSQKNPKLMISVKIKNKHAATEKIVPVHRRRRRLCGNAAEAGQHRSAGVDKYAATIMSKRNPVFHARRVSAFRNSAFAAKNQRISRPAANKTIIDVRLKNQNERK